MIGIAQSSRDRRLWRARVTLSRSLEEQRSGIFILLLMVLRMTKKADRWQRWWALVVRVTAEDIYDSRLAGKKKNRLWADRKQDDRPLLIMNAACETGQKDWLLPSWRQVADFSSHPGRLFHGYASLFQHSVLLSIVAERIIASWGFQSDERTVRSFPHLKMGRWFSMARAWKEWHRFWIGPIPISIEVRLCLHRSRHNISIIEFKLFQNWAA